jgi:hypothetical protein
MQDEEAFRRDFDPDSSDTRPLPDRFPPRQSLEAIRDELRSFINAPPDLRVTLLLDCEFKSLFGFGDSKPAVVRWPSTQATALDWLRRLIARYRTEGPSPAIMHAFAAVLSMIDPIPDDHQLRDIHGRTIITTGFNPSPPDDGIDS